MPDKKEKLKALLRAGIPADKRQAVSDAQVSQAAEELLKIGSASEQILEGVGSKVANDRLVFNRVDIDDVVTVLDELND